MSDRFEQLFEQARPDAIRTIRPPGTEAVRRTVRRRRRRTVLFAAVAVLAVLGGVTVLRQPGPGRIDEPVNGVTSAPHAVVDTDKLAAQAHAALGKAPSTPAVDRQAAVNQNYSQASSRYLGGLTLSAACAGDGSFTLVVSGIPGSESTSSEHVELARITVPCAADPKPVSTDFAADHTYVNLGYELEDITPGTDSSAGFAYRIVSDTGEPLTDQDDGANPTAALHLTSDAGYGAGLPMNGGEDQEDVLPSHVTGKIRIAVACAGTGQLRVMLLTSSGGVLGSYSTVCGWPPERQDFLPPRLSGTVRYRLSLTSHSEAPADVAIQFIPR